MRFFLGKAGISYDNAPRAVFFMAVLDNKDSYALFLGKAGIACNNAPGAVFSSLVHKPLMLGIMADMNQRDSCPEAYSKLDFLGYGPLFLKSLVRAVCLRGTGVASFPGR